jgi:hypothetical protein
MRERSHPIGVKVAPPKVYPQVATIGPTQVRERLRGRRVATLSLRIVFVVRHEHADPPHAVTLLRSRHHRPRRRARKPRDELSPSHGHPSSRVIVSLSRLKMHGNRTSRFERGLFAAVHESESGP